MDFAVDGQQTGKMNNEIKLTDKKTKSITATFSAYLPETVPTAERLKERTYWDIEWARTGESREVALELIVNGRAVDTINIIADGKKKIKFNYPVENSSWIALRIPGSSHSNAIFVTVAGKPVNENRSAEWCRKEVDRCWEKKSENIRAEEKSAAQEAYDKARKIYDAIIEYP